MNRTFEKSFLKINAAFASFMNSCREEYAKYSKAVNVAKSESEKFVDADGYFKEKKSVSATSALSFYHSAHKQLVDIVQPELDKLSEEYRRGLMAVPSQTFVNALEMYKSFKLTPTRAEAEELLRLSCGSPLALRALRAVLEPAGLTIAGTFDAERDLKVIADALLPNFIYIDPDGLGLDIWVGQECPRIGSDGTPYSTGRKFTAVGAVTASNSFTAAVEEIKKMGSRWSSAAPPRLAQLGSYKDMEDEEGNNISVIEQFADDLQSTSRAYSLESDSSVALARKRAKQDAAEAEAYARVMQHYGGIQK